MKQQTAFTFRKLSEHINSNSCCDVSPLTGKYLVLITTSITQNSEVFSVHFVPSWTLGLKFLVFD